MSDSLRDALEKQLGILPTAAFDNGYLVKALPEAVLLELLAAHPVEPAISDCPTCNGRQWINGQWVASRETVGMVCQTCGHDYATEPAGVSDEAVEVAAKALHPGLFYPADRVARHAETARQDAREATRTALEAALPYLQAQPVASRERVEKALRGKPIIRSADKPEGWRGGLSPEEIADITAALLAAGVFREPEPECGAAGPRGRCVFTPGHHEVENWTSHGDRGGWTWNDQPAEVES